MVTGASVLSASAGLLWVWRLVPLSFLHTHHEVADFFISVLSVIYTVILGFVVLVGWEDFAASKATVA